MKKRLSVLLALTLTVSILCTGLAGCGKSGTQEKNLTKVTLNEVAHSIFYAPQYVAIEEGYFEEEGIDLDLVTGFGADKTMTAVLSGEADIGFMGSESSIYVYSQNPGDYIVNFAQLTQRAGNFLVAREPMENFQWADLRGSSVLGGRKGGMPQMVFEYILKKNNLDPETDMDIDQSIDFGSTAAAFSGGQGDFTVEQDKKHTNYANISLLNSRLSFARGVQSSIPIPGSGTKRIEINIEGISSNSVIIELIVSGSTYVFVAAVYKSNNMLAIDLRNLNTADANISLEYTVMI